MKPDELPPPGPYPHRKIQVYECDPWDPPFKRRLRLRKDLKVIAFGWCAMAAVGIVLAICWPSATATTMAVLIAAAAVVVTWQVYRVIKRT